MRILEPIEVELADNLLEGQTVEEVDGVRNVPPETDSGHVVAVATLQVGEEPRHLVHPVDGGYHQRLYVDWVAGEGEALAEDGQDGAAGVVDDREHPVVLIQVRAAVVEEKTGGLLCPLYPILVAE